MENKQQVQLTDEALDELAKNPNNIVYKWVDSQPLPETEIVPLEEVKSKITRLYEQYTVERQSFITKRIPIDKKRWEYIKSKILKNIEWKRFEFTHPLIFNRILHPETTEEDIKALHFMLFLKEQEKNGNIQQGKGKTMLAQYIMDTFSVTQDKWDEIVKRDTQE
jgi:hypothetical protein